MTEPTIYSIGYGNRPPAETIRLVHQLGCAFLIDVRSSPYSKFLPGYNREDFGRLCQRVRLKYVFMGDQLGGRPTSPDCYDPDGKVNYEKMERDVTFLAGMQRLETAISKGFRVVIMCSELHPEQCHRSKLIGKVLADRGHWVGHLDSTGAVIEQDTVLKRITGGQSDFFGSPDVIRSRGAYKAR